jgi:Tfp pilus assembly protein FimT
MIERFKRFWSAHLASARRSGQGMTEYAIAIAAVAIIAIAAIPSLREGVTSAITSAMGLVQSAIGGG